MSWEGYTETLCENGHFCVHDELGCMYESSEMENGDPHKNCMDCGGPIQALAIVDVTNGCDGFEGSGGYKTHQNEKCSSCRDKLRIEKTGASDEHGCLFRLVLKGQPLFRSGVK